MNIFTNMNNVLKIIPVILLFFFLVDISYASIGISNVVCQQQYPWNGKIDIDYEISGDESATNIWVYATGYDKNTDKTIPIRSLSGDGVSSATKIGKHRMTWDSAIDYPSLKSSAFTVTLTAFNGKPLYMVIDLSGGPDATSYPISYLPCEPAGGWTEEYKTSKLVMRYILPGRFMMGSPEDELGRSKDRETQHEVILTKPFYIGVFEVTQKQYELITGLNPSQYALGDTRPVSDITFCLIRGVDKGSGWPENCYVDETSFLGKLRARTKTEFDIPTEAQWEYACRAGTTTSWNDGTTITNEYSDGNLSKLGRYRNNGGRDDDHAIVGSYLPNAWGLYDMHGNIYEWCLDWFVADLGSQTTIDPKGPNNGEYRVTKGGCFIIYSNECRSANRYGSYPGDPSHPELFDMYSFFGFRLVLGL